LEQRNMRNYLKAVALIALSGMCMAAPRPSENDSANKKSTRHHHVAKPVKKDMTADRFRELKETVDQQRAAMQQMQEQTRQQIQQMQQQLQTTQAQLTQTQQTAQQADAKVVAVETNSNLQVQRVQSDLSDVKTALNSTTQTIQVEQKRVGELEQPNSIAYKGIRLTPGGFVELTGLFRSHATLSDQATPYNSIPVGNQPNTKLTEFLFTARDSRLALRADTDAGSTKLAAYYEMDFLGTGPTSNPNQSTSYNPRLRQAWGRAKLADGWTITGGQTWNLITLNRKGTDADNTNLWIPNFIEAQYQVGYDFGRFGEIRVSKAFGEKVSFAFELANPSYLSFGNSAAVGGLVSNGVGLSGNSLVSSCTSTVPVTCTTTPTYSTNLAPDMITKVSYDNPKLGHYEVKALGRFFRDRVLPTAATAIAPANAGWNNTTLGYGVGFGAIVPVMPKKVDFIAQGLFGKGISRYEDSGQYDFVVHSTPDHNMQTIQSYSLLAGIESHPTRKIEADLVFGDEYYYKTTYTTQGTVAGYGAPTAVNTGCFYEVVAAQAPAGTSSTCTANNRNLAQGSFVAYYDLYKGPRGTLRYGAQYEYIYRRTWAGVGGAPKGIENGIFTTMRYIFP
jgi:hypothetical protein